MLTLLENRRIHDSINRSKIELIAYIDIRDIEIIYNLGG